ncbi:DNA polymerase sliding clamp [Candidatus Gugararchaeum adminiculabundum]|nr:DNA polymerase sliding clamp [Candidatus Gugararchaeum adminiculabundum]
MFNITVSDAHYWKDCIDAIVNLIDEGSLEISKEGISLRAMDPSQIAMVVFNIPKSAFSDYKVESTVRVGLNFENLAKILSRTRGKEKLEMSQEENKFVLHFSGEGSKRSFKIPLIDLQGGVQKEPKIEHDAEVKILAGSFKEMLRDAALVSSHLTLEATEHAFSVGVAGDNADLHSEMAKGGAVAGITTKKPVKATFPLQYLDDIVKACADKNEIKLSLRTNVPIKINYKIEDADLTYYLAPRIDAD